MAKVLGWWTAAVVAAVLLGTRTPREARTHPGKGRRRHDVHRPGRHRRQRRRDRLTVESITKSVRRSTDVYDPGDVRKATGAVLVIRNGLGLDGWFDQFTDDLPAQSIDASNGVVPIPIASDAYAGKMNPHAWMSPLNVETYVDNIVKAFIRI